MTDLAVVKGYCYCLSLHVAHRHSDWLSGKAVYSGQAVLESRCQRQLNDVDVYMVVSVIGRIEAAQRCPIVPMDFGALAVLALPGPVCSVFFGARSKEALSHLLGRESATGV